MDYRLKILKDTYTVGQFYQTGQIAEVQPMLARAMIERGQAEDIYNQMPEVALTPPPVIETTTELPNIDPEQAEAVVSVAAEAAETIEEATEEKLDVAAVAAQATAKPKPKAKAKK